MNANSMFPSKYLKASDLAGKSVLVTIDRVAIESMGRGKGGQDEQKPVVYFLGKQKGLVLNKTNNRSIMNIAGQETDNWKGTQIVLYPMMTEMGGEPTEGIRITRPGVQVPVPPTPPVRITEPAGDSTPITDSDVPF